MSDHKEIIIFNDDETPMDFVISILKDCFSKTEEESIEICYLIDSSDSYSVGVYPTEEADNILESCLKKIKDEEQALIVKSKSVKDLTVNATKSAPSKGDMIYTHELIKQHFDGIKPDDIVAVSRRYPARVRVDLQTALEEMLGELTNRLIGVHLQFGYDKVDLSTLLETGRNAKKISPLQYEDVDIGEDSPKRCLSNGLWFLEKNNIPFLVLMGKDDPMYGPRGGDSRRIEVVCPAGEQAQEFSQYLFSEIDNKISQSSSYRGKVLSLEQASQYTGESTGVKVHKLEAITGDDVILSEPTLKLIDRCVIKFSQQRELLRKHGQSSKRGVLFYGPPGTGKTHTIRYLASALPDHTTLLITAEQIGLLDEYMALARLLQPSMVVIEDRSK